MKKALLILLLIQFAAKSQDTLATKKSQDSLANLRLTETVPPPKPKDTLFFRIKPPLAVQIFEINPETIKYRKADNPDGPLYTVSKSEIRLIKYANGSRETIDSLKTGGQKPQLSSRSSMFNNYDNLRPDELYVKGQRDARIYYRHPGGSIGTAIATSITGPFGLIPAIICSSVPPHSKHLGYPSRDLWDSKDYQKGYRDSAKSIKRKRVWLGFGIGAGTYLLLSLMLGAL
jgi:hypothetical protein